MRQFVSVVLALCALAAPANARNVPENPEHKDSLRNLTEQQKLNMLHPFLRRADDCVVEFVEKADSTGSAIINDLIVKAMESCVTEMQIVIERHDYLYGEGTGETFFFGPYLDLLPTTVEMRIRGPTSSVR